MSRRHVALLAIPIAAAAIWTAIDAARTPVPGHTVEPERDAARAPAAVAEHVLETPTALPTLVVSDVHERREAPSSRDGHMLGDLDVRANDPLGAPVPDLVVIVLPESDRAADKTRKAETGPDGVARFDRLAADSWLVMARSPFNGVMHRAVVDVGDMRVNRLEFSFAAADQEIAASGLILDEHGKPLSSAIVAWSVDGSPPSSTKSAQDGRFTVWSRRGERVELSFGTDLLSDRFEPDGFAEAFGAHDLVFRRKPSPERRKVTVDIVDRLDRHRVRRGGIRISDGRATAIRHLKANLTFELFWTDELRVAVLSPEYRDFERPMSQLLTVRDGHVTIELDRGFHRVLTVVENGTRLPLADVVILKDGLELGRTGHDGRAVLDAAQRPVSLELRSSGHLPLTWRPAFYDAKWACEVTLEASR